MRLLDGSGFNFCRRMRTLKLKQPILMLTVRVVNVHIRRLREKVELDASKPEILLTVPGVGYRLVK